jgi:hypothetical protein
VAGLRTFVVNVFVKATGPNLKTLFCAIYLIPSIY